MNYFEDTMRAGHYENDAKAVELMIRSSNSIIRDLLQRNVTFERDRDGRIGFHQRRSTFSAENPFL